MPESMPYYHQSVLVVILVFKSFHVNPKSDFEFMILVEFNGHSHIGHPFSYWDYALISYYFLSDSRFLILAILLTLGCFDHVYP